MAHISFDSTMPIKIMLAFAFVSLCLAAVTHGALSIALATLGFIAITAFVIVVLIGLLTRD